MAPTGLRLDQWLVRHGYAETRSRAQWLIETGQVWVRGQPCRKPSLVLPERCQVDICGSGLPYVSRGGLKLEHALQTFGIDVTDFVALDVGASTGGFTDCLLQRGAQRVYALDVGRGQLAPRLRNDPRVISLEGRNMRMFRGADLPEAVDLITVDLSFISLKLVLPRFPPLLRPHGRVIALVKPQFEVGADHVGRGGIVRDRHQRELALHGVIQIAGEAGFHMLHMTEVAGSRPSRNQEFCLDLVQAADNAVVATASSPMDGRKTSPGNGGGQGG